MVAMLNWPIRMSAPSPGVVTHSAQVCGRANDHHDHGDKAWNGSLSSPFVDQNARTPAPAGYSHATWPFRIHCESVVGFPHVGAQTIATTARHHEMTRAPFVLEDLLQPALHVVFCGTAAGRVSAQQQAYYAHPQNKFWHILHETGLTPRRLRPQDYRELLTYGIGLTDIAKHTFGMDNQLPVGSLGRTAVEALRSRIEVYAPGILAFTSLKGGSTFLRRRVQPGAQEETIGTTRIWVLPSPAPTANWKWDPEPWFALAAAARIDSSGSPATGRSKAPIR